MYYRVPHPSTPLRDTHISTSSSTKRPKSTSDRPPKPPNAFILFRTAYNQAGRELAKTISELTSVSTRTALQQGNVSRDAGQAWRALGEDGRKEWEDKADMLRYEHEQKWGDTAYRASKYNLRVDGEGVLQTSDLVRSKLGGGRRSDTHRRPPSRTRGHAKSSSPSSTFSPTEPQRPTSADLLSLQPLSSSSAGAFLTVPYGPWTGHPLACHYFPYYPLTVPAASVPEAINPSILEEDECVAEERESVTDESVLVACDEVLAGSMMLQVQDTNDIDVLASVDVFVACGDRSTRSDGEELLLDSLVRRRSSPPPACIDPRLLLE